MCESVRVQCVVARGCPAAFDDDESHQDASTGCRREGFSSFARDGMEGGLHRPLFSAIAFSAIAYEKLAGYNQGTNPCCLAGGERGVRGAQREARRNGGCCVSHPSKLSVGA